MTASRSPDAGSGASSRSKKGWRQATIRLHWVSGLLLVLTLAVGWAAEHLAQSEDQILLYEAHFSLALLTLMTFVARIGWRAVDRGPKPERGSVLQAIASASVHGLLYLVSAAAILSGLINFLFLGPVRIFGLVHVPRLFDPDADEWLRAMSWYVHHYSYLLLIVLIALHAGAAFFHHFVLRDDVLKDFAWRRGRVRR